MSTRIKTPVSTELISYTDAAAWMRIDFPDDEQTEIELMIKAARMWVENYLQRAVGTQTLQLILDDFVRVGSRGLKLRGPVQSITSVTYLDSNGDAQTLTADEDYRAAIDADQPEIRPIDTWPAVANTANAVTVEYVAGYSVIDGSPVTLQLPAEIRAAILMQAADLYENRHAQVERELKVNNALQQLLAPYRLGMGI